MPTPGAPLVWVFGSGHTPDLSVTADPDSIRVHVAGTDSDEEVRLGSASELVVWLKTHRTGSLLDQRGTVIDKLKSGRLFKWE
jgi:hypothetical protein